jgi:hypothetical protein
MHQPGQQWSPVMAPSITVSLLCQHKVHQLPHLVTPWGQLVMARHEHVVIVCVCCEQCQQYPKWSTACCWFCVQLFLFGKGCAWAWHCIIQGHSTALSLSLSDRGCFMNLTYNLNAWSASTSSCAAASSDLGGL